MGASFPKKNAWLPIGFVLPPIISSTDSSVSPHSDSGWGERQCVPSKKGDKRAGRWADRQVNCSPRFRTRAAAYKCFLQLHLFSWDQPPALHRCPYHLPIFNGKICLYWILPQLSDFSNTAASLLLQHLSEVHASQWEWYFNSSPLSSQ